MVLGVLLTWAASHFLQLNTVETQPIANTCCKAAALGESVPAGLQAGKRAPHQPLLALGHTAALPFCLV